MGTTLDVSQIVRPSFQIKPDKGLRRQMNWKTNQKNIYVHFVATQPTEGSGEIFVPIVV